MKILHLITSLDKGGAESHLVELAKAQKNKGNDVTIIFFKGNKYWQKYLINNGIKTIFFSFLNTLNFIKFFYLILVLKKFIIVNKIQIIHAHLGFSEITGCILKFFFLNKIKLIITKHLDSYLFEGSKSRNRFLSGLFLEKIIFKYANHIICISHTVKEYFLKSINVSKKKISVIYYGYSIKKINNKLKKKIISKFNLDQKTLLLCNIARHVPQKNLFFLLDVFEKIIYEHKINAKLVMVGKGFLTNRLKKYAARKKINEKIIWINFCENIRELINSIDIFCLTSNYEGLGLVLLEAMAEKKPIIATNTSAIPEIIRNNFNGILFNKNNKDQFVNGVKKIMKNKIFKKKIVNNSYKKLKTLFTIKKMTDNTLKIYNLNEN